MKTLFRLKRDTSSKTVLGGKDTEIVHKIGAAAHNFRWLKANVAAVDAIRECGFDPSHELFREVTPVILLRVLNQLFPENFEAANRERQKKE
jgi:hypothetical protein